MNEIQKTLSYQEQIYGLREDFCKLKEYEGIV
jgi:hypothetical protein